MVLNETGDYLLEVQDTACAGVDVISLRVNQYGVDAGADTAVCAGLPAGLQATLYGNLPSITVDCGTTVTPFSGTPIVSDVIDSTGFGFDNNTPFNSNFMDTRAQYLYKAADLLATGLQAGSIRRIGWNVANKISFLPFQGFTIRIGCTEVNDLPADTWLPTQVVYNSAAYFSVQGWNSFNLQNPYNWDGSSNLVVEICFDNFQFEFGSDQVLGSNQPNVCVRYAQADNDQGCSMSPLIASSSFFLPTISLTVTPAPPVQPLYVWSPAAGLSDSLVSNPVAAPAAESVYTVQAIFPDGCVKRDSVRVAVSNFSYTASNDTLICAGSSASLAVSLASSISWQPATDLSCADCFTPVASPATSATYSFLLEDDFGCQFTDSVSVLVNTLDIQPWFADTLVDQGVAVTLGAEATSGQSTISWSWSPGDYLTSTAGSSVVSTPLADVLYTVVADDLVCTDTQYVQVRVNITKQPFVMPDAFTPNGDGQNDVFFPVTLPGTTGKVSVFRIYNRWGEMVFDGSGSGWDGFYKGAAQPVGDYRYYLEWEVPFQALERIQGSFTLLR